MFDEYRPEADNEQIWQNIEPHLKKKKKRRPFILFFWGLGLGILLLFLWGQHNQAGTPQAGGPEPSSISSNLENPSSPDAVSLTAAPQSGKNLTEARQTNRPTKRLGKGVDRPKNFIETLETEQVAKATAIPTETSFAGVTTKTAENATLASTLATEISPMEAQVSVESPTAANQPIGSPVEVAEPKVLVEEQNTEPLLEEVVTTGLVNKEKKASKGKKPSKSRTKPHRRKRDKQTLSLHAGLILPIKVLKPNSLVEPNEDLLANRKASEKSLEAISGSMYYTYATKKGLLFRAGLDFKRLNERFRVSYEDRETKIVTGVLTQTVNSLGQVIAQTMGAKEVTTTRIYSKTAYNYYQFLNMPLGMGYQRINKRSQWELAGGLNFNLWFRANGTIYNEYGSPRSFYYPNYLEDIQRKAGLGLWATYGYSRNLSRNVRWQLSVKADVPFKNITTDSYALVQRYYTLGLQGGLIFNLTQEKKSKHKKR